MQLVLDIMKDLNLADKNVSKNNLKRDLINCEINNQNKLSNIINSPILEKNYCKSSLRKTNKFIKDFNLIEMSGKALNINKHSILETNKTEQNQTIKDILETNESSNNNLSKKLFELSNNTNNNDKNFSKENKISESENEQPTQKEPGNRINLRNLINSLCNCNCAKLKKQIVYFQKAEALFDEFFDAQKYILKMNEVEILKKMILNDNQILIFDFLFIPTFSYSLKRNATLNPESFGINKSEGKIGSTFELYKLIDYYEILFGENEDKNNTKRL